MGDIRGFLKHRERELPQYRPVNERVHDWKEVYEPFPIVDLQTQASRCMDCGIPFCNEGCPLGNLIPDWNDLVYRDHWKQAIDRLHATNNFPEFTGRLCPAPCEGACVLGINQPPVTIKQVEVTIIDRAFEEGWVVPLPPAQSTGKSVAVVGSGPAGLAAAQQLTRAGHRVVVFERADRIGGLLRYGIPEFKMEKRHIDRRLDQMRAEGTEFRTGVEVVGGADRGRPGDRGSTHDADGVVGGADRGRPGDRGSTHDADGAVGGADVSVEELQRDFDAVVLAGGATKWRDLPIAGRDLDGIHQAMEYLPWSNKAQEGDMGVDEVPISAKGRSVVIIGGGDTGADCLGTANRQGAEIVHQFEIMPRPPDERPASNPWPTYPMTFKTTSAHEEGVERVYSVNTEAFLGDDDGRVRALQAHEVRFVNGRFEKVDNSDFELEADLVLLAMGFVGPEQDGMLESLGVDLTDRGNVARDDAYATSVDGVWVCGDMGRGQSLIVWAIAEGRACAAAVDEALMGQTALPAPISASKQPLRS